MQVTGLLFQRPARLKEQSNCAGTVTIKPEGIDAVDVLRDVARKDCNKEKRGGDANFFSIAKRCKR